jgi:hypothetical protein
MGRSFAVAHRVVREYEMAGSSIKTASRMAGRA